MPFKDKKHNNEYMKEYMRNKRAAEKAIKNEEQEKKTVIFEIKGEKYGIEFWVTGLKNEPTPDEIERLKAKYCEGFVTIKELQDSGELSGAEIDSILKCMIPKEEPSKKPILNFIPDLLSMHLDFKMLHQRGSKKSIGGY